MSILWLLFFANNLLAFFAAVNTSSFLAVVKRLSIIFSMEEFEGRTPIKTENPTISLDGASFSWGFRLNHEEAKKGLEKVKIQREEKPILSELSINLKKGDHVVVVGQVGCGKTSLLFSLMEETKLVKGGMNINGTVAYVEQEPFIISGSIKDNITMGLKLHEDRFQKALEASCLIHDIKGFKKGADTIIGERGINISGG